MVKQEERSASTRAKLLAAFRRSLLIRGLEATTTQLVLDETGLSKGALYHHFRGKDEVIEALYAYESKAAIERAFGQGGASQPAFERLKAGCIDWLNAVNDPEVARILFRIGPFALGHKRAREIEDENGIARIRELLEEAQSEEGIPLGNVDLLASFISALVAEAVLHRLKSGGDVRPDLAKALDAIIDGFTQDHGKPTTE